MSRTSKPARRESRARRLARELKRHARGLYWTVPRHLRTYQGA